MSKTEFIEQLRSALNGLSEEDLKKSVDYYEEMIDDRIEDGIPEEEAVSGLGSIDEIKNKISEIISSFENKQLDLELLLYTFRITAWMPMIFALIIFIKLHKSSFNWFIFEISFRWLAAIVLIYYVIKIYYIIKTNKEIGKKWYSNIFKKVFLY